MSPNWSPHVRRRMTTTISRIVPIPKYMASFPCFLVGNWEIVRRAVIVGRFRHTALGLIEYRRCTCRRGAEPGGWGKTWLQALERAHEGHHEVRLLCAVPRGVGVPLAIGRRSSSPVISKTRRTGALRRVMLSECPLARAAAFASRRTLIPLESMKPRPDRSRKTWWPGTRCATRTSRNASTLDMSSSPQGATRTALPIWRTSTRSRGVLGLGRIPASFDHDD